MNINFNPSGKEPKGVLGRLLTWVLGGLLLVAALMFSLVFFAVLAVAGMLFWIYFWWKTRTLREQMEQMRVEGDATHEAHDFGEARSRPASSGEIIEGEAVRVPEEQDKLPR